MKMSEAFPSRYLKATDIKGKELNLKISACEEEEVGEGTKPVLYFVGKEKGVVLNRTNADILAEAYGDDTDGWKNKPVVLATHRVAYKGEMKDGFTFRTPAKNTSDEEAPF
jgi:hypothetical protein